MTFDPSSLFVSRCGFCSAMLRWVEPGTPTSGGNMVNPTERRASRRFTMTLPLKVRARSFESSRIMAAKALPRASIATNFFQPPPRPDCSDSPLRNIPVFLRLVFFRLRAFRSRIIIPYSWYPGRLQVEPAPDAGGLQVEPAPEYWIWRNDGSL